MHTKDESPNTALDWESEEDRFIDRRSLFIGSTTGLPDSVATALAYRELGYTASGIAKRIDRTESTVRGYLDDVAESLGFEVLETKLPDDIAVNTKVVR